MGIPHLITCLRPFAVSIDLSDKDVVIDGPGLAYHVWYICLSLKPKARNPFEATPSYRLLGDLAIRWLDELQIHGVCLKKIFFDGLLPSQKRPVRINRITGYTKQLNNYHQAWPQIIPKADVDTDSQSSNVTLFPIGAFPSSYTRLPAAPFLVPAIIEALSTSDRYAELVEVVPGEADLYCANYVRTHDGIVLTGDSDLLIHELGNGAVSFFKDLDISSSANKTSMTCIQYQVSDIVKRLGLPEDHGLLALAFEMTMDSHASFRELLQRAVRLNAISLHGKLYQDFSYEYKSFERIDTLRTPYSGPHLVKQHYLTRQLRMLDPRVSEYLLQFSDFTRATQSPQFLQSQSRSLVPQTHIDVFLPFLLDCPLNTSAWEMSTSVRQLAYGLVNLVLSPGKAVSKIAEYRRLQNGSRGREREVPAANDLQNACASLHEMLGKLKNAISPMPEKHLWRAIAIFQDLQLHLGSDKPGLCSIVIRQNQSVPFRLTWESIHLSAQFQGSYYSFRILKQVLSIVLSYDGAGVLPPALHLLHTDLESLPALREFPTAIDVICNASNPEDPRILEIVEEILDIPHMDESIKVSTKRKKKARGAGNTAKVMDWKDRVKAPEHRRDNSDHQRDEVNNIFEIILTD